MLEILLAMSILSIVMTMVSIALSGSLNILSATRDQGDIYHRAHVALLRISEDLASTVLDGERDFIGSGGSEDGQEDNILQFTSTAHVVFNRDVDNKGLAVISYSVQEDEDREGELFLIRSDQLLSTLSADDAIESSGQGFILSDRLKAVSFRYFDAEGEELESWTTELDSITGNQDRMLPVAVACTLEFWLDKEQETSLEFTTRVLLPVGLIQAQNDTNKSTT